METVMEEDHLHYLSKTELIQMIKSLTKRNEALQHLNAILTEDVPSSISRTLKSVLTNRDWRGVCAKCCGPVAPVSEDVKLDATFDAPASIKRESLTSSCGSSSCPPKDLVINLDDDSDSFKEEITEVPDFRYRLGHMSAEIVQHDVCVSTTAVDVSCEVRYPDMTICGLPEQCLPQTDHDREVKFIGQIPYLTSAQMFSIELCKDWKKLISLLLSYTYTKEEMATLNSRKRSLEGKRQVMSEGVRSWIFSMVNRLAPDVSKAEISQNISYKIRDARKSFNASVNRLIMKDSFIRNE